MASLVCFRHDLRVRDHPALNSALTNKAQSVIALFVITPLQWQRYAWGTPRVTFLMASLNSLRLDLKNLNIPLVIRQCSTFGQVPHLVLQTALEYNCTEVHAGREFGIDEAKRDRITQDLLDRKGIPFHLHETQTILPVEKIRTQAGNPYSAFTPFRRRWEKILAKQTIPSYENTRVFPDTLVETTPVPAKIDGFDPWPGISHWPPGSNYAEQRLENFLSGPIERYHKNRDRPDLNGCSTLSPWFTVGALSPITCMRALFQRYGNDLDTWPRGPRVWQGELVWREFYRHVMAANPKLSRGKPMQDWTTRIPWREDEKSFKAWCHGETGVPIVDAGMKQMAEIGWMHNRVRMITAMFLTKNLLINWRRGEEFFSRMLVDYDFPSNNGGWQWAASTGTDAAPYFRIFNPLRQEQKFDPNADYVKLWLSRKGELQSKESIVNLTVSRKQAIETFKSARKIGEPENYNV